VPTDLHTVVAAGILSMACERWSRIMGTRIADDIAVLVLGVTVAVSLTSFVLLLLGYP
jgi:hypothetical protein